MGLSRQHLAGTRGSRRPAEANASKVFARALQRNGSSFGPVTDGIVIGHSHCSGIRIVHFGLFLAHLLVLGHGVVRDGYIVKRRNRDRLHAPACCSS